jgi:prepilin-type N-terminal cleavage/methylation domain-containing protein
MTGSFPFLMISHRRAAFTLVELLVSMAILVLLITVVVQIVDGAQKTTGASKSRLECDAEARTVFDRMALDFGRMVNRKDVDFVIKKDAGNDSIYFFSEAPAIWTDATNPQQPVSLVGYRVNNDYQLERLGKGLTWNAAPADGPVYLTYQQPTGTPPPPPATPTPTPNPISGSTLTGSTFNGVITAASDPKGNSPYHVIGRNVFRMEVSFLLKPYTDPASGTLVPAAYSVSPYIKDHQTGVGEPTSGQIANNGVGLSDVQAITVTIALMDSKSHQMITRGDTDFSPLSTLISDFPDAAGTDTPAKAWEAAIPTVSGINPKSATSQIRVYQRTFVLNSNGN